MSLTFETKKAFINHFGSEENWENEYDAERYAEQINRKRTSRHGNISLTLDRKGVFARAEYTATHDKQDIKSFVELRRTDNGLEIHDESGRTISYGSKNPKTSDDQIKLGTSKDFIESRKYPNTETIELQDIGAVINFHGDGRKTVLIEETDTCFAFDTPTSYNAASVDFGGLMNTVEIDQDFASQLGIGISHSFLDAAKMVVAIDMGLEPDIKLFNSLDDKKGIAFLNFLLTRKDNDIDPADMDVSSLQQSWDDTVDFTGYYVAAAQRFSVVKGTNDNQYRFKFGSEDKQFLRAQSSLMKTALSEDLNIIETFRINSPLSKLIHTLDSAGEQIQTSNIDRQSWHTMLLKSDKAGALASDIRRMVIEELGTEFSRNFVSSISFDRNKCMVSMRTDALERLSTAMHASTQIVDMIKNGSTDVEQFRKLIETGADLKYIDPHAAHKGRTFSDMLEEKGNAALQDTLNDIQGERVIYDEPLGPEPE